MEANPSKSSYGVAGGERGAGGKLRKPPARKSQATPYARPSASTTQQGRGSWLSKLVDPAYRLVSTGATMLMPSFFSSSAAALPPPPPENIDNQQGLESAESDERSSPVTESSDEQNDVENDTQLSGIEQLIKGKSFTRGEINRLVEMLHSKVDESAVEGNKRLAVEESKKTDVLFSAGKSVEDMRTPVSKLSDKGKQKDLQNVGFGSPMPAPKIVPDEIGASPIDIARAYMGRFSEYGSVTSGVSTKVETAQKVAHEFAPTPFIPSSAPRSSRTCWPGSMAQQPVYTTPNHRDRRQFHDFPRTPYSRTVYSKSTTRESPQVQTHNKEISSSSHLKQSQTPIFEQVKYGNDRLENSYGSVGPVRRLRMKYASEVRPRESIFSKYSKDVPSGNGQPAGSLGEQFDVPTNSLFGETSASKQQPEFLEGSKVGYKSLINPAAEDLVKNKIKLLDFTKATPQKTTNELEIARGRKSSTVASVATPKENMSSSLAEDFISCKRADYIDPKPTIRGNTNRQGEVQERNASTVPSLSLRSPLFQPTSLKEKADQSILPRNQSSEQLFTTAVDDSRFELLKKPPLHTPGTKPNLSHISVGRRDPGRSDNGFGFTFPVSTSSSALSEPPTPSIMPFSTGELPSLPKELLDLPAFTFGSNKSTPRLSFSFPSASNAVPKVDEQDLKFEFGSDKKRLSFSTVATC